MCAIVLNGNASCILIALNETKWRMMKCINDLKMNDQIGWVKDRHGHHINNDSVSIVKFHFISQHSSCNWYVEMTYLKLDRIEVRHCLSAAIVAEYKNRRRKKNHLTGQTWTTRTCDGFYLDRFDQLLSQRMQATNNIHILEIISLNKIVYKHLIYIVILSDQAGCGLCENQKKKNSFKSTNDNITKRLPSM